MIHGRTDLLKYFDFVLTSADFTRSKPNPEPYLLAVERSGCAPQECVAIEDSERGLLAATLAGIRCIVVPTPLTRGCAFASAHCIVSSAGQVPALCAELD
jgi:beta-phosphoglucomutase-like phosphatase (HAD superfamily)